MDMRFDPPLDLFDLPILENEEWFTESNATVSGTYRGTLDVEGLPEELISGMIEEGLSFPMVLEDLDTGMDEANGGILNERTVPIRIPVSCTGTGSVTLPDGSSTETYAVQFGTSETEGNEYFSEGYERDEDGPGTVEYEDYSPGLLSDIKFLYSPAEGFFVGIQVEGLGDLLGLDGMPSSMGTIELSPISTNDAEKNMGTFQKDVSDEDIPINILLPLLVLVVILIVLAVLAIAGIAIFSVSGSSKKK